MKKTTTLIKNTTVRILFSMIFMIMFPSMSLAQESEHTANQNLTVSASVLMIAANSMSISYDGLPGKNSYTFKSTASDMDVEQPKQENLMTKFTKTANQMTQYFLKYVKVEDTSADNTSGYLLKSKVDTVKMNPNDFKVNVSLLAGYDDKTSLRMDGVKIESYWCHTFVNATYNYEKNEVEIGLSNASINEYLMNDMKLEFQTNPTTGSTALLLSKSF
jgi:hypothetical protein